MTPDPDEVARITASLGQLETAIEDEPNERERVYLEEERDELLAKLKRLAE